MIRLQEGGCAGVLGSIRWQEFSRRGLRVQETQIKALYLQIRIFLFAKFVL